MRFPEGFAEIPQRLTGNTQSGHKVIFGVMNGQEVALKPFTGGEGPREHNNKARHEERMYKLVAECGYLTLVPTGVIEMPPDAAFLVTQYEPNLMPISALPLAEAGLVPVESRGIGPTEAVLKTANLLGHFHNDRLTHGDAQPRNFSFHRSSGIGPIIVDLEHAQYHPMNPKANEFFPRAARKDIWLLAHSLGHQGFGGQKMRQALQIFDEVILDPYHEVAETALTTEAISSVRNGLAKGRGSFFGTGK